VGVRARLVHCRRNALQLASHEHPAAQQESDAEECDRGLDEAANECVLEEQ
jgi:hypothetical protein